MKKMFKVVLVLLSLLMVLAGCAKTQEAEEPVNEEPVEQHEEVKEPAHEVLNLALFGVDVEDMDSGRASNKMSDTVKILSLDLTDKTINMVSVSPFIVTVANDELVYVKDLYKQGQEDFVLKSVNAMLDTDVKDYVSFDYEALRVAIDAIGGVEVELSDSEIKDIKKLGIKGGAGTYTLDGKQALEFIKYIPYDRNTFADQIVNLESSRMERLIKVIKSVLKSVKESGTFDLLGVATKVFPYVHSNLNLTDLVNLVSKALELEIQKINNVDLPSENMVARKGVIKYGVLVNSFVDLAKAANEAIHSGEANYAYEASDAVKALDAQVKELAAKY